MNTQMKFNSDVYSDTGQRWYNLTSNAATKHADIYLYGVIGGYNVNVQRFLSDLQGAGKVDTITVYLNTVGGSFYDGLPIYNTLKQHKAKVTVKVMGYALSMGSVIMLAGDTVEAAENSLIMMHRAQGGIWGDADDLLKGADILQKHEDAIVPEYSRRMGKSAPQVKQLLADETWFTAEQAQAAGLIDAITGKVEPDADSASMQADNLNFINQHYQNIPAEFTQTLNENTDMNLTPENIKAIADEVVKTLKADDANYGKQTNHAGTMDAENAALKKQNAAMAAELADLKTEVPPSDAGVENTGFVLGENDPFGKEFC